jgi:hypothetical protein
MQYLGANVHISELPNGIFSYQKIPILVNLVVPWNVKRKYIYGPRIFYGHLVYFMSIWYIYPVLVWCTYQEESGNHDLHTEYF